MSHNFSGKESNTGGPSIGGGGVTIARRRLLAHCGLGAVAAGLMVMLAATPADAAFPEKPIHIVVAVPAGSNSDIIVRRLGPKLEALLGQAIVVDNVPGGNSMLGAERVAKSAPDGYTMLFGTSTILGQNLVRFSHVPYDAKIDFSAVGLMGLNPAVLVVNKSVPAKTVAELIAHIKANSGKLNYASAPGSSFVASQMLLNETKLDIQAIPFKSTSQAVTDLLSGATTFMFSPFAAIESQVRAGELKAIATTGPVRMPALADVPTMVESGHKGFAFSSWIGFWVPSKTPKTVINTLHKALVTALSDAELKDHYQRSGTIITTMAPEETDKFVADQIEWYKDFFPRIGIKPK